MKLPSKYLEKAVEELSTLPGIGKRSALRLALNLLNRSEEEIATFARSLTDMKEFLKNCKICGNVSDADICSICSNPGRDLSTICIVEDIRDVLAIEATGTYKGGYHVLGGVISPMEGIGPGELNISRLVDRVQNDQVHEIIFALSPTMEGDTTNYYLFKKLSDKEILITCLSRGVSVGTELQYADENSLGKSLIFRQPFKTNN
jgi:recombination protein RecR